MLHTDKEDCLKIIFCFSEYLCQFFATRLTMVKMIYIPSKQKARGKGSLDFLDFFFGILISLASSQFITTSEGYHDPD